MTIEKNEEMIDAISEGDVPKVLEMLNDPEIDIDYDDGSPIRLASINGYYGIVQELINKGADPSYSNYRCLELAKQHEYQTIIDLLEPYVIKHKERNPDLSNKQIDEIFETTLKQLFISYHKSKELPDHITKFLYFVHRFVEKNNIRKQIEEHEKLIKELKGKLK